MATGRQISVIVPAHPAAVRLPDCVAALAAQTLEPERFEVLVVRHALDDGSAPILAEAAARHPALALRVLVCGVADTGAARNVGLDAATGGYVTFIDPDDTVSPGYLAGLLAACGTGIIAVAQRIDVDPAGNRRPAGPSAQLVTERAGRGIDLAQALPVLESVTGKALPRALLDSVRFDPDLRSGEDLVFLMRVVIAHRPRVRVVAEPSQCFHTRVLRPDTLPGEGLDRPSVVDDSMATIARVAPLFAGSRGAVLELGMRCLSELVLPVAGWVRAHPEDAEQVRDEARAIGADLFPYSTLQSDDGTGLVIAPSAPPASDRTAHAVVDAVVAAGGVWDIAHPPLDLTHAETSLLGAIGAGHGRDIVIAIAEDGSPPQAVADAAREAAGVIGAAVGAAGRSRPIRTLGADPTVHLTGARVAGASKAGPWTADLRLLGAPADDPLLDEVVQAAGRRARRILVRDQEQLDAVLAALGAWRRLRIRSAVVIAGSDRG